MKRFSLFLLVPAVLYACESGEDDETTPDPDPEPECAEHADCAGDRPYCDVGAEVCIEAPPGSELGWGETAPALTVVLEDGALKSPVDLAFNPSKPAEVWIVNRTDDSVVIVNDLGGAAMTFERRHDPAASHFMDNPPALAMGSVDETWGQTFATCGDSDNGGNDFMGPALFTTMLDVYAESTPGGLGSHLDMLHSTTFCRGIAHVENNVYFAFNSVQGSIDRYDFKEDHDPGNDDHSDGTILRYGENVLTGVDGVASHLVYDGETKMLYAADTGSGRVIGLDTMSGTVGNNFSGLEPVEERKKVEDAVFFEVVPAGVLTQPSGIELHRGLLFVTDHATSTFHAFDTSGQKVASLETGLPPGSLAGFAFGPDDGRIYFVDLNGRILRVDAAPAQ